MIQNLSTTLITVDARCQPRVVVSPDVVAEYAGALREGAEFPPLVVFFDGTTHWLADGFHRLDAALQADVAEIACDVRDGAMRDAILFACGANQAHGLRRSNGDKHRAVLTLLHDDEWSKWSSEEIARRVGVSPTTVGTIRSSLSKLESDMIHTYTNKYGQVRVMDTSNIGKAKKEKPIPVAVEPDDDWDAAAPPPPAKTRAESTSWMTLTPAPTRAPSIKPSSTREDNLAVTDILAFQQATSRDPKQVARAAFKANSVAAKVFAQRGDEIETWLHGFIEEIKRLNERSSP
jgi:hypothetical protein